MKYITKLFQGRINRLEYISTLLALAIGSLLYVNNLEFSQSLPKTTLTVLLVGSFLLFALSIMTRRLQDINLPGWLTLLYLAFHFSIPLLSYLYLLALAIWPGNKKANNYGPPPKGGKYLLNDIFGVP
jgi:uncharacterized membrane protein YhaH (DUF805 family)